MANLKFQTLTCVTFTIVATLLATVHGFTAGAPPLKSVCRDMVPQHHEYKPQVGQGPYLISVNVNKVEGGSNIKVMINSTDDTKVRGFYIQARNSETNMPIGTFIMNKNVGSHSCNGLRYNAATHNNGHLLKDFVEVEWTAPSDFDGEVLVLGTVLRDFVTFWSGIYAEPVTVTKKTASLTTRNPSNTSLLVAVKNYFRQLLNILGLVRSQNRN